MSQPSAVVVVASRISGRLQRAVEDHSHLPAAGNVARAVSIGVAAGALLSLVVVRSVMGP